MLSSGRLYARSLSSTQLEKQKSMKNYWYFPHILASAFLWSTWRPQHLWVQVTIYTYWPPPTVRPVLGNVQVPVYQVIDETLTTNLIVLHQTSDHSSQLYNSIRPKNIALLQGWTSFSPKAVGSNPHFARRTAPTREWLG